MADDYVPPDLAKFVVEAPLYTELQFRLGHDQNRPPEKLPPKMPVVKRIAYPAFAVDAYCKFCKRHSVFNADKPDDTTVTIFEKTLAGGSSAPHSAIFRCSRLNQHLLIVTFHIYCVGTLNHYQPKDVAVTVTKIGMWPSLADVNDPIGTRFSRALGEKDAAEFRRAVGLVSHGIGIGAFVYLRRVFEDLVNEVATVSIQAGEVERAEYDRSRMEERIAMLKARLPSFLVEHKQWYGIVSKGIHELEESECLDFFPVVRSGIEIMLEQKAEALERADREKEAGAAIQRIADRLKKADA